MNGIRILGTGRQTGSIKVHNKQFEAFVETSDEWIKERTGIESRYLCDGETTSEMGAAAAKKAIEKAGISKDDIGMIICSTTTPDSFTPSVAARIQALLGVDDCVSFDIAAACSGFVFALDIAQKYLALGMEKKILVVASERLSQFVDYSDRTTCVLFGDAAGACVLEAADSLYVSRLGTKAGTEPLLAPIPRNATPFGKAPPEVKPFLTMNGKEVYKFATAIIPEVLSAACEKASISPAELKIIIPHQANIRITQTAAKNMGLSVAKFYMNIGEYGNTSSATIPIALDELCERKKLERGDKIAIVGFGAGLTYGAAVIEW